MSFAHMYPSSLSVAFDSSDSSSASGSLSSKQEWTLVTKKRQKEPKQHFFTDSSSSSPSSSSLSSSSSSSSFSYSSSSSSFSSSSTSASFSSSSTILRKALRSRTSDREVVAASSSSSVSEDEELIRLTSYSAVASPRVSDASDSHSSFSQSSQSEASSSNHIGPSKYDSSHPNHALAGTESISAAPIIINSNNMNHHTHHTQPPDSSGGGVITPRRMNRRGFADSRYNRKVCRYFLQGNCAHGSSCHFSHEDLNSPYTPATPPLSANRTSAATPTLRSPHLSAVSAPHTPATRFSFSPSHQVPPLSAATTVAAGGGGGGTDDLFVSQSFASSSSLSSVRSVFSGSADHLPLLRGSSNGVFSSFVGSGGAGYGAGSGAGSEYDGFVTGVSALNSSSDKVLCRFCLAPVSPELIQAHENSCESGAVARAAASSSSSSSSSSFSSSSSLSTAVSFASAVFSPVTATDSSSSFFFSSSSSSSSPDSTSSFSRLVASLSASGSSHSGSSTSNISGSSSPSSSTILPALFPVSSWQRFIQNNVVFRSIDPQPSSSSFSGAESSHSISNVSLSSSVPVLHSSSASSLSQSGGNAGIPAVGFVSSSRIAAIHSIINDGKSLSFPSSSSLSSHAHPFSSTISSPLTSVTSSSKLSVYAPSFSSSFLQRSISSPGATPGASFHTPLSVSAPSTLSTHMSSFLPQSPSDRALAMTRAVSTPPQQPPHAGTATTSFSSASLHNNNSSARNPGPSARSTSTVTVLGGSSTATAALAASGALRPLSMQRTRSDNGPSSSNTGASYVTSSVSPHTYSSAIDVPRPRTHYPPLIWTSGAAQTVPINTAARSPLQAAIPSARAPLSSVELSADYPAMAPPLDAGVQADAKLEKKNRDKLAKQLKEERERAERAEKQKEKQLEREKLKEAERLRDKEQEQQLQITREKMKEAERQREKDKEMQREMQREKDRERQREKERLKALEKAEKAKKNLSKSAKHPPNPVASPPSVRTAAPLSELTSSSGPVLSSTVAVSISSSSPADKSPSSSPISAKSSSSKPVVAADDDAMSLRSSSSDVVRVPTNESTNSGSKLVSALSPSRADAFGSSQATSQPQRHNSDSSLPFSLSVSAKTLNHITLNSDGSSAADGAPKKKKKNKKKKKKITNAQNTSSTTRSSTTHSKKSREEGKAIVTKPNHHSSKVNPSSSVAVDEYEDDVDEDDIEDDEDEQLDEEDEEEPLAQSPADAAIAKMVEHYIGLTEFVKEAKLLDSFCCFLYANYGRAVRYSFQEVKSQLSLPCENRQLVFKLEHDFDYHPGTPRAFMQLEETLLNKPTEYIAVVRFLLRSGAAIRPLEEDNIAKDEKSEKAVTALTSAHVLSKIYAKKRLEVRHIFDIASRSNFPILTWTEHDLLFPSCLHAYDLRWQVDRSFIVAICSHVLMMQKNFLYTNLRRYRHILFPYDSSNKTTLTPAEQLEQHEALPQLQRLSKTGNWDAVITTFSWDQLKNKVLPMVSANTKLSPPEGAIGAASVVASEALPFALMDRLVDPKMRDFVLTLVKPHEFPLDVMPNKRVIAKYHKYVEILREQMTPEEQKRFHFLLERQSRFMDAMHTRQFFVLNARVDSLEMVELERAEERKQLARQRESDKDTKKRTREQRDEDLKVEAEAQNEEYRLIAEKLEMLRDTPYRDSIPRVMKLFMDSSSTLLGLQRLSAEDWSRLGVVPEGLHAVLRECFSKSPLPEEGKSVPTTVKTLVPSAAAGSPTGSVTSGPPMNLGGVDSEKSRSKFAVQPVTVAQPIKQQQSGKDVKALIASAVPALAAVPSSSNTTAVTVSHPYDLATRWSNAMVAFKMRCTAYEQCQEMMTVAREKAVSGKVIECCAGCGLVSLKKDHANKKGVNENDFMEPCEACRVTLCSESCRSFHELLCNSTPVTQSTSFLYSSAKSKTRSGRFFCDKVLLVRTICFSSPLGYAYSSKPRSFLQHFASRAPLQLLASQNSTSNSDDASVTTTTSSLSIATNSSSGSVPASTISAVQSAASAVAAAAAAAAASAIVAASEPIRSSASSSSACSDSSSSSSSSSSSARTPIADSASASLSSASTPTCDVSETTPKKEAASSASKKCAYCGVIKSDAVKLKLCTGCSKAYYCSTDHQRLHWKDGHKLECSAALSSVGSSNLPSRSSNTTTAQH